jgi:hypothetical protein
VQSRGSRNPVTGPASDRSPDKSGGGGYTFIDSSFPRRPGDIARLSSQIFPPTGTNLELIKKCQSFALQDNQKVLISGPNVYTLFATSVDFVRALLRTLAYSVSDWWTDNNDRGNQSTRRKHRVSTTFSAINLIWSPSDIAQPLSFIILVPLPAQTNYNPI